MNKNSKRENESRIEQLIDVVEKHTRTERHLEQYSDISSPENIANAEKVQKQREEEIDTLKNLVAYGNDYYNDDVENLKGNYEKTKGYMHYNASHMSNKDLNNLEEKQKNRKEQLDILE